DLIRIFASERVAGLMARLGFDDATPIESGMVTGAITQAQIKVEGRNFDIRKRALEFDDVLNNQRNVIYGQRRLILEKGDVRETVLEFLRQEADGLVDTAAATASRNSSSHTSARRMASSRRWKLASRAGSRRRSSA